MYREGEGDKGLKKLLNKWKTKTRFACCCSNTEMISPYGYALINPRRLSSKQTEESKWNRITLISPLPLFSHFNLLFWTLPSSKYLPESCPEIESDCHYMKKQISFKQNEIWTKHFTDASDLRRHLFLISCALLVLFMSCYVDRGAWQATRVSIWTWTSDVAVASIPRTSTFFSIILFYGLSDGVKASNGEHDMKVLVSAEEEADTKVSRCSPITCQSLLIYQLFYLGQM